MQQSESKLGNFFREKISSKTMPLIAGFLDSNFVQHFQQKENTEYEWLAVGAFLGAAFNIFSRIDKVIVPWFAAGAAMIAFGLIQGNPSPDVTNYIILPLSGFSASAMLTYGIINRHDFINFIRRD